MSARADRIPCCVPFCRRTRGLRKVDGERIEACMAERLLNDIRGWDRRATREVYAGSEWTGFVAGLTAKEKAKWEAAAARLRGLGT